ncbi:MAG: hypothetical protein KDJ87_10205 [Rhizobiaceae bacterium]|nr:hypothetical protein [Rhizobiaceae bacterium]
MPPLEEVGYYLRGLWLLVGGKPEGFQYLDFSERGFWRSWWAILFCLPPALLSWASFRIYFLSQRPQGTETGLDFYVKLAVIEAANWLLPILLVLLLARVAGFGRAAMPLIVALNWLSVPLQWAYVPVSLLQIWAPADMSAALLYLLTLGLYVFVTYRIAATILGGQRFPAFVLVMVIFSVPLMIQSQLMTMLGLVEL